MSISDKIRKELWGKSGNKCAICHIDLIRDGNADSYNIGEECHIISERFNGPRHIDGLDDYNTYDNLLLLCRNHHKEIDDPANISKYSITELKKIKEKHETWVSQKLAEKNEGYVLPLIKTGSELISIIGAHLIGVYKGNDEIRSAEEAEFIGGIWQELTDYIDIASDLEPCDVTKMEYSFSQLLGEMAAKGYFLFGRIKKVRYGVDKQIYNAAELFIKRIENL